MVGEVRRFGRRASSFPRSNPSRRAKRTALAAEFLARPAGRIRPDATDGRTERRRHRPQPSAPNFRSLPGRQISPRPALRPRDGRRTRSCSLEAKGRRRAGGSCAIRRRRYRLQPQATRASFAAAAAHLGFRKACSGDSTRNRQYVPIERRGAARRAKCARAGGKSGADRSAGTARRQEAARRRSDPGC